MGVPLPPKALPLSPLKKSNSLFIVRFLSNLEQNIFICLPITIEITIYKWGSPCPPPSPPPSNSQISFMVQFCLNLIQNGGHLVTIY